MQSSDDKQETFTFLFITGLLQSLRLGGLWTVIFCLVWQASEEIDFDDNEAEHLFNYISSFILIYFNAATFLKCCIQIMLIES